MEYKVLDFNGQFKWFRRWDDCFLVDPEYVDDFKNEYPEAIQVFDTEKKKEEISEEEQSKRNKELHKQLIEGVGAHWIMTRYFKEIVSQTRSYLSIWTPLSWERARRKQIREYVSASSKEFPEENLYNNPHLALERVARIILFATPRDVLKIIIEELEFLTAKYEEQKALAVGTETAAERSQKLESA